MLTLSRTLFSSVVVGLVVLILGTQVGETRAAPESSINVNAEGVAAKGYDLVSYFSPSGPVMGHEAHSISHDGAKYFFASPENLWKFMKNPEMYLPAYGGFCSYGVVLGKKFDISPDAYRVVDNVLFLQLDKGTRLIWEEDRDKNIEIGNRTWPNIKNIPADNL